LMHNVVRGMGLKAGDDHAIPLCGQHHDGLHRNGNETAYLAGHGIHDAPAPAKALWDNTGDYSAMLAALSEGRK